MPKKIVLAILCALFIFSVALVIKVESMKSLPQKKVASRSESRISTPILQKETKNASWKLATSSAGWSPRDAHSVVTFKNALWLIGGLEGNGTVLINGVVEYWKAPHKTDIWRSYDGLNWDKVADYVPWGHRRSISTVIFQNKLWLMGGWDNMHTGYNSRVWNSDDGIYWKEILQTENTWPPREGQVVLEYKNKLWLMGGVNFATREGFNDVWYSDDGISWKNAIQNAPWEARYDHAVTVFNGKIYLTGGKPVGNGDTFRDVWSTEDGAHWKLETRNPSWISRHGHISLVYQNKLWVVGGWHMGSDFDGAQNDTWFSENGKKWEKLKQNGPWLGREDHMGDVFKNKIWLTGGMDGNFNWNSDVWYLEEKTSN